MKAILKAISRKKPVTIVCLGKEKRAILPSITRREEYFTAADHPFFGSVCSDGHDVAAEMKKLRSGR
jgi:hypothetical protein